MKLDDKTMELIAVGASVTAGCQPCLEYHARKAQQNGATEDEVAEAIAVAKMVRGGGATERDRFVNGFINAETHSREKDNISESGGCDCGGVCC